MNFLCFTSEPKAREELLKSSVVLVAQASRLCSVGFALRTTMAGTEARPTDLFKLQDEPKALA
jgi:hypothetical protein